MDPRYFLIFFYIKWQIRCCSEANFDNANIAFILEIGSKTSASNIRTSHTGKQYKTKTANVTNRFSFRIKPNKCCFFRLLWHFTDSEVSKVVPPKVPKVHKIFSRKWVILFEESCSVWNFGFVKKWNDWSNAQTSIHAVFFETRPHF